MKIEMGVWIDHRQAVIVTLLGEKEEIRRIRSNIGREVHFSADAQIPAAPDGPYIPSTEITRAKARNHQLGKYYAVVARWLSTADSIMIFGPGEAKNELQKRLLHHDLATRVIGIKAADKMSAREFATEVRQEFGSSSEQSEQAGQEI